MSDTCDYEICTRKLDVVPYTPIEVKITVSRGSKKLRPEEYEGKFCSWRCASDQQDLWFQRSLHV